MAVRQAEEEPWVPAGKGGGHSPTLRLPRPPTLGLGLHPWTRLAPAHCPPTRAPLPRRLRDFGEFAEFSFKACDVLPRNTAGTDTPSPPPGPSPAPLCSSGGGVQGGAGRFPNSGQKATETRKLGAVGGAVVSSSPEGFRHSGVS